MDLELKVIENDLLMPMDQWRKMTQWKKSQSKRKIELKPFYIDYTKPQVILQTEH